MRADICDPHNDAAVQRFRSALRSLGATLAEKYWGLGVNHYRLKIGGETLSIFSDAWSVDIDGPDQLVLRVLREFENTPACRDPVKGLA